MLRLLGLVLAFAGVTACYRPAAFESCELACAANGTCPNGLECNAQKRCASSAATVCSALPIDSSGDDPDGPPGGDDGGPPTDGSTACSWTTSNVDACDVNAHIAMQDLVITDQDLVTIDTDALTVTRNGNALALTFTAQDQMSGPPQVAMLRLRDFTVGGTQTSRIAVTIRGARPLLVFVNRTATINGTLVYEPVDLTAAMNLALCDDAAETAIANHGFPGGPSSGSAGGGGGGGGSYGTNVNARAGAAGGRGADIGGTAGAGGGAGRARVNGTPVPLRAGCPGGRGGNFMSAGGGPPGFAGGAIQISARTLLTISGSIVVPGGLGGVSTSGPAGHGGGGSGGAILLEAPTLALGGSALCANGGPGGGGANSVPAFAPVPLNTCTDQPVGDPSAGQGASWSFDATTPADRPDNISAGGFGGGGGVGVIRARGTVQSQPSVSSPLLQPL